MLYLHISMYICTHQDKGKVREPVYVDKVCHVEVAVVPVCVYNKFSSLE